MNLTSRIRSAGNRSLHSVWAVLLCAAATGSGSPAAATDECPNAGNLVRNCGFEAPGGVAGSSSFWNEISADKFDLTSAFAHTGGFSGILDAIDQGGGTSFFAGIETCVEGVVPGTIYLFGAWRNLDGGGPSQNCTVLVEELGASVTPCGGAHIAEYDGQGGPAEVWEEIISKFVANANTQDLLLSVSCSATKAGTDFLLYVDDVYLIDVDTIFVDDFEFFPDTCYWSASVPDGCG